MLPELLEQQATGEIATIYEEIRTLCGVPYVSSMQRHLATRPGWLEWAWRSMRPVFVDGSAQTTAWRVAAEIDAPSLPPLSRSALRALGVEDDGERAIRTVCESFIRVSPTNLMFSGILRLLLAGERPTGTASAVAWSPPSALPGLPSLVHPDHLTPDQREVLLQLGTEVAGYPFIPGLYRMLAHWPAYLAHVATVLGPRFGDPTTRACCLSLVQRLDEAVRPVFDRLPVSSKAALMSLKDEADEILAALDRYRVTSPEMVIFGTLIRNALPPQNT